MTEDTSPENQLHNSNIRQLVKYLESDDPVMTQIGLSMLNRTNVTIEGWLDWGSKLPLKTSYHLAKKAGIEHSDDVIETLCKRLGSYNTDIQRIMMEDTETVWWALRSATVEALQNPMRNSRLRLSEDSITDEVIGESQVIQDGFSKDYHSLHTQLYRILCYSDKRFVNYLIDILNEEKDIGNAVRKTLDKIKDNKYQNCLRAAEILGEIADIRAVKPLAEMLQNSDERETYYGENRLHLIHAAGKKALENIAEANVEGDEKQNILKFLKSDDQGLVIMGASMLKGILEESEDTSPENRTD
ncbi:MAG TPA: hypothetical protein EYN38_04010 [Flavobacteriales bacterium]|nr:hypothetical protein [Flavobacteriales bacterium]